MLVVHSYLRLYVIGVFFAVTMATHVGLAQQGSTCNLGQGHSFCYGDYEFTWEDLADQLAACFSAVHSIELEGLAFRPDRFGKFFASLLSGCNVGNDDIDTWSVALFAYLHQSRNNGVVEVRGTCTLKVKKHEIRFDEDAAVYNIPVEVSACLNNNSYQHTTPLSQHLKNIPRSTCLISTQR